MVFSFDAAGLQLDDKGYGKYSLGVRILKSDGKQLDKSLTVDYDVNCLQALGRVPLEASYVLSDPKMPAGTYTMEVSVTDLANKDKKPTTIEAKFELVDKGFGIVRLDVGYDAVLYVPGRPIFPLYPTCGHAVLGQTVNVNFGLVGFERKKREIMKVMVNQPALEIKLRVLDEKGEPLVKQSPIDTLPKTEDLVPEEATFIPLFLPISLTRAGKFTVEVTATDLINPTNTATVAYPLIVTEPPK